MSHTRQLDPKAARLVLVALIVAVGVLIALQFREDEPEEVDPGRYELVSRYAATFQRPLDLARIPGKDGWFVVEQVGLVRRLMDSTPDTAPVAIDFRSWVSRGNNEEGLLSLVFHPKWPTDPRVFVYYSAAEPRRSVIASIAVPDPLVETNPTGQVVLMEIPQPYGNHNGGDMAFGPDGMLYVSLGDGGAGGDPEGHGQNPSTLLGSILRLSVDDQDGKASPAPGNPFLNDDAFRPEIWAYGLRNAWRMTFDEQTGRLWLGDVGQNEYEEINVVFAGDNLGWNAREGAHDFEPDKARAGDTLVEPVAEYSHAKGQSITGGVVYHGNRLCDLRGAYIYGDFVSRKVWALIPTSAQARSSRGRPGPNDYASSLITNKGCNVASFAVHPDGDLLLACFDREGIYALREVGAPVNGDDSTCSTEP